ncbi:hypothetical protein HK101_010480 [Irineochytrium annulatum]|nr:hypothetical protein HK101_010480 [Irineochytrium annulatum]
MFNSADYVVDLLNNPTSVEQGKGGKLSRMNVGSLPALAKQGIAMTLIQLEPCGINEPHTHPRASEAIYVISGDDVQIGFIEENGAKVILNELHTGQSTFIPQGAIHFEINMSCKPAVAIAANNNEDPGTLSIPTTFYKLPDGSLKASLGIEDDEELAKLKAAAPGSPGPGIAECRQKCGLDGGSYYGSNLGAKKSEKKRIGWH